MSEDQNIVDYNDQNHVTSPTLDTPDTLVRNDREFSNAQTLELTDDEIQKCWRIIQPIRHKWKLRFQSKFRDIQGESNLSRALEEAMKMVDEFEDEIKTRLYDVEVLATVNTLPVLEGQPLEIEFIGKMPGSNLDKYGMDHERKGWEVKRATARGEDYYGQHDG